MRVISVREEPAALERALEYFKLHWADGEAMRAVYDDTFAHTLCAPAPLPQWYILDEDGVTAGCAGLITNDFLSRMDLWPWICAVYVEPAFRGRRLSGLLFDKACSDAAAVGFGHVYVSTSHVGLYEKFGFEYIGRCRTPSGSSPRMYSRATK